MAQPEPERMPLKSENRRAARIMPIILSLRLPQHLGSGGAPRRESVERIRSLWYDGRAAQSPLILNNTGGLCG
jgi:hypothetical protein